MEQNEIENIQNQFVGLFLEKDEFIRSHPDFIDKNKCRKSLFLSEHNLHITHFGCLIFQQHIQKYSFQSDFGLTSTQLIKLSKFFKHPFYIKAKTIYLFCDAEEAFFINLCGEVERYLENLNS